MKIQKKLILNNKTITADADPSMPLLWLLRGVLGLTGTKYGCGKGQCGVCTVIVDGVAVRSCQVPWSSVTGPILTIESFAEQPEHPIIRAFTELDVPQCGFCQPAQVMSCLALLDRYKQPDSAQIYAAMNGLCRCGTYQKIGAAVQRAAALLRSGGT